MEVGPHQAARQCSINARCLQKRLQSASKGHGKLGFGVVVAHSLGIALAMLFSRVLGIAWSAQGGMAA